MSKINATQLQFCKTQNQVDPLEGPTSVPVPGLVFAGSSLTYELDLGLVQSQGKFTAFQGLYCDNLDNGSDVTLRVTGMTNQRLVIPAGALAYLPVLSTNPVKLTIESPGTATVGLFLLNFPVAACVWIP